MREKGRMVKNYILVHKTPSSHQENTGFRTFRKRLSCFERTCHRLILPSSPSLLSFYALFSDDEKMIMMMNLFSPWTFIIIMGIKESRVEERIKNLQQEKEIELIITSFLLDYTMDFYARLYLRLNYFRFAFIFRLPLFSVSLYFQSASFLLPKVLFIITRWSFLWEASLPFFFLSFFFPLFFSRPKRMDCPFFSLSITFDFSSFDFSFRRQSLSVCIWMSI